jgi:4-amino-4-deoxy-L-arabinose transferase-like glycosyltransferase
MEDIGSILEALLIPEVGYFLLFLIFLILLWVILRRIKNLRKTLAILEIGHQEFYYQSFEMRKCRSRLISTERTDMKAIQTQSTELLAFFDRLGFLTQKGILPQKELWQFFGTAILGYFSFLVPFIQWLRMEERDPELYLYFEDLNDAVYRQNYKINRRQAHPLMEEEELNQFIEEEKAALSN